jgi:hypothetical protein
MSMTKYLSEKQAGRDRAYTEEEIVRGLNALISFGGSPAQAHRALIEAFDLEIPKETLRSWRDSTHAERYTKLQRDHGAQIEDALVRDTRDLARAAAAVERLAIEKTVDALEGGRLDPSQVAVNMSKIKQSNIDKLLALTGRPNQIVENRSATDILRALEAKGVLTSGT